MSNPVSFLFDPVRSGDHVHVDVRAGQAPHRALAGTLTLRANEWSLLAAIIQQGASVSTESALVEIRQAT